MSHVFSLIKTQHIHNLTFTLCLPKTIKAKQTKIFYIYMNKDFDGNVEKKQKFYRGIKYQHA